MRKARQAEVDYIHKMNLYDKVPISECWAKTGQKPIDTKWVDVNKGDTSRPNYRSRLVGKEYNQHKDDSLYAATPPLEALRIITSWAATHDEHERAEDKEVMINDVSRAYFYAKATRDLYIRLPPEDPEAGPGKLGKLNLCLYGTRDAARGWQETLSKHLEKEGFRRSKGFPSVFYHPERDLSLGVHGDDFTVCGQGGTWSG